MDFDEWLEEVDSILYDYLYYKSNSTEDYPWSDDWADGLEPEESVQLYMNGFTV